MALRSVRWGWLLSLCVLASCGGSGDGGVGSGARSGGGVGAAGAAATNPVAAACSTAFDTEPTSFAAKLGLFKEEAVTPVGLSQCKLDEQRNVTIGGDGCGPNVIIDRSFTGSEGLGEITIAPDGKLAVPRVFDALELHTRGIGIEGLLSIGTAACPVGRSNPTSQMRIVFTGSRPKDERAAPPVGDGADKGIELRAKGILRLYGAKGVAPTGVSWTHLSRPAGPAAYQKTDQGIGAPVPAGGERTLQLARDVRAGGAWRAGDWIVVATSSFSPFESEFVQIDSIGDGPAGGSTVTLKQPLRHYHFGGADPGLPTAANYGAKAATNFGVDERTEVGLISRNIVLTAETPTGDPTDANRHWGGEIRILPGFGEAIVQGVELEKFGKARLGSYPIHFHMAGDAANRHLIDSNSIHHSYNKCVTLHATQGVAVSNNVCARAVGHLFYQEMGQEQGAKFVNNLGVGAMSHNFGLHESVPKTGDGLVQNWWEGDNLAKVNGYDGLNVPNTDNQANPTHGRCFVTSPSGRLQAAARPSQDGGVTTPPEVPCNPGELYAEQSTGFWVVNPGTVMEGNSIAGCQGMGKGYWYVPPAGDGNVFRQRFEPVGSFLNNRVHGCYDGLFGETDVAAVSQQLFPTVGGKTTSELDSVNVIAHFRGFTATRIRNRGVWMRPMWTAVEDGRFATNRDSVSLVSSGGNDGNGPGVWALLKDSVLVGVSTNNVDRWGPCPRVAPGDGEGCVDTNPKANELFEHGYQTPRWNSAGYMIYDGPVRIVHNHFVNYLKDVKPLLTVADRATLDAFVAWPNPATKSYQGDAALGWFQNNQSAYPTATVSRALSFDNVDLRHQIYTEQVNLGDFRDGDKNTALIDLDGTLTGYKVVDTNGVPVPGEFPISLNNLPFNRNANAVDECLATGQQDVQFEDRPTSIISPANTATLEFEAQYPPPPTWQDMVFIKDNPDAGVHQSMALLGRDAQGLWEPKVASGVGYTVRTAPSTAPQYRPQPAPAVVPPPPPTGMPATVRVGFTDAVKPDMDKKPFYVRLGICYSNQQGKPPAGNAITIQRGYKSWGGNGVSYNNPALQTYFNFLSQRHGGQSCFNLDRQNPQNLVPGTGCPAEGVTPVPANGVCPAPSTRDASAGAPVCVYPRASLSAAASIAELTRPDGTPADFNKYFFDSKTGMLFFYVLQDATNAHGVGPLGSCRGRADDDPACPGANELDTFYSCPPQGCINYSVQLNEPSYQPGPSTCDQLAGGSLYGPNGYALPEPPIANRLAHVGESGVGAIVNTSPRVSDKGFTHWTPDREPSCQITTPLPAVASAGGAALRTKASETAQWLRSGGARVAAAARWPKDWFTTPRPAVPDIATLAQAQICSATAPVTAMR